MLSRRVVMESVLDGEIGMIYMHRLYRVKKVKQKRKEKIKQTSDYDPIDMAIIAHGHLILSHATHTMPPIPCLLPQTRVIH